MMYYYNDYVPYHMFGFGGILMVIFWGFVIYGIVLMFRGNKGNHLHGTKTESAMEILKERYAKGEITKEEFHSIKDDIK